MSSKGSPEPEDGCEAWRKANRGSKSKASRGCLGRVSKFFVSLSSLSGRGGPRYMRVSEDELLSCASGVCSLHVAS